MRPIDELAAEICGFTGHMNAAHHRWLMLIAEFDRRNGWADASTKSCAHWLNWKCGIAIGAAREKVRVGRALENLPRLSAAMESGRISYSKVREITRVAIPETEGKTKPSNLVSLCRFHHRAVHEGGIRIERLDDGPLRFVKANGDAIDNVAPGFTQPLGDWQRIPPATQPISVWRGDRMNLDLAVDVALQLTNKATGARHVPAGT
jgi:hypothetical protein